jgi:hypothetical protein
VADPSHPYRIIERRTSKDRNMVDRLEEAGLIDKELSIAAKHSKLKGLLNPISISGGLDNPLEK